MDKEQLKLVIKMIEFIDLNDYDPTRVKVCPACGAPEVVIGSSGLQYQEFELRESV